MKLIAMSTAALVVGLSIAGCAATATEERRPLKPEGGIMTIDEDMYDLPAFAEEICKTTGYRGAVLISRDAAAKKSTYQCGR